MMNSDDFVLVLLRDQSEPPMWIDIWAKSYPVIQLGSFHQNESPSVWQARLQQIISLISEEKIIVVAHGAGANALAWYYYHADILMHKKMVATILVAPLQSICEQKPYHDVFERVRFSGKTAWVSAPNDDLCPVNWAKNQAQMWNARFFETPPLGHLNQNLASWEWGMKLMQEMIL